MQNKTTHKSKTAKPKKLSLNVDSNSQGSNDKVSPQVTHIAPQHTGINLDTHGIETEMRRDYLYDNLVIIAPNRGKRPYDTRDSGHTLIETASSPRLDRNVEVCQLKDSDGDWLVEVVENKYPSLTSNNPQAYGKQEIVIDTPLASTPFSHLSIEQITNVLRVYQDRTKYLLDQNGIEYVLVFRNDGYEAGASLAHAHSQIFALPVVPQKFLHESELIDKYIKNNHRNPFDDIIEYEKRSKKRVVFEDDTFLVFCPYASQWPFELWILPKQQITSLVDLERKSLKSLAKCLKQYLRKLNQHKISFNIYFENGVSSNHRLCIKICGRSNIWGGFELATGIVINTVPPESAAKWYNQ
jgi:UDPglucose--hexose-1-phosphate uridylyltransferase